MTFHTGTGTLIGSSGMAYTKTRATAGKQPRSLRCGSERDTSMITGIAGDIGAGKTLVMTKYVLEEFRDLRKRTILTNYHLKGGIPHRVITPDDLLLMAEQEQALDRACIALDEIHIWLDSRMSNSNMNLVLSYFINQTGKSGINLYYTTQSFDQVDKRLRKRTDVGAYVRRKGDMHLVRLENMNNPVVRPKHAVVYGPEVWPYYDTKEVVKMVKRK